MDGHPILRLLVQGVGVLLILVVLLDVFLTVLYARIGTGVISDRLTCWTWRFFRWGSRWLGRRRAEWLSLAGPVSLVLLVSVWGLVLMCGAALVIWPRLGTSIQTARGGQTPADFVTAMYIAGDNMTTVGAADFSPTTSFFRLFYTFLSLAGMSMITLTLTYFLEIYNSLQRRNTFALKVHFATGETGDAADLVAGLGAQGNFDVGYTHLAEMSSEMISFKEAHHFYSVVLYFRFREPHYAVSRLTLVVLDSVSLIKSALDDQRYAWLKESAAVAQLWRATMAMFRILEETFFRSGIVKSPQTPDDAARARWRRRYFAALERLRQAGVKTIADEEAGAEAYIALRAEWEAHVRALARFMAHTMEQIDPAGCRPEEAEGREDFSARLRSAG